MMSATASDLRMFAVNSLLLGVIAKLDGGEAATLRESADRVKCTADALDALRDIRKGCGDIFSAPFVCPTDGVLCGGCADKREAAINALLGEGGK